MVFFKLSLEKKIGFDFIIEFIIKIEIIVFFRMLCII